MTPPRKPRVKDPPPPGCSSPGHSQACSIWSIAAPSAWPASMISPVLVPAGAMLHSAVPGTPCSVRSESLPSKPPAATMTPRSPRIVSPRLGRDADDAAVLDDVVGDVLVGQHGAAITYERHQRAGDQRLATAEGVAAALAGTVTLDRRTYESRHLGGQLLAADVGGLDRSTHRYAAGHVEVLGERRPLPLEGIVGLELGDQLGRLGEEHLDVGRQRRGQESLEVRASALRRVTESGPLLHLGAREPAGSAGVGRRAADLVGALEHHGLEPGLLRKVGADQGASTRSNHDHVICHVCRC